jgi:hypothetical protein
MANFICAVGLFVSESFDWVFAAGDPSRIRSAQKSAGDSNQRSANNPSVCHLDWQRWMEIVDGRPQGEA